MAQKINPDKLAPSIIGGIIENLEERPLKNLDWIESVSTDKNNVWTVWIKPKSLYYPESIIKYNKRYKTRLIKGKLYQIEDILEKAWNNQ